MYCNFENILFSFFISAILYSPFYQDLNHQVTDEKPSKTLKQLEYILDDVSNQFSILNIL